MIRRPPSSPLFPSTTLSRSLPRHQQRGRGDAPDVHERRVRQPLVGLVPERLPEKAEGEERDIGLPRHARSEEHTSELQSRSDLVCRLLLEKKKRNSTTETKSEKYFWNYRDNPLVATLVHLVREGVLAWRLRHHDNPSSLHPRSWAPRSGDP